MHSKETDECNSQTFTNSPPAPITLGLLCEETRNKSDRYILCCCHPIRRWRRRYWGDAAAESEENQQNVMWVDDFANVRTNCEFDQAKLGGGGGECVEGAPEVWWWCEEGKVFVKSSLGQMNAVETMRFVTFRPVFWFRFYTAKICKTQKTGKTRIRIFELLVKFAFIRKLPPVEL